MEPESADGYSAWISVDDVKLPQYKRTVATAASGVKEVTCWIGSEVGKEFAVNWSLPASKEQTLGKLWIDGRVIGRLTGPPPKPSRTMPVQTISYERVSTTSVRPIVFSRRELTDDDAHVDENTEHLGDIRLDIWTVRMLVRTGASSSKYSNPQLPAKTHERSKKAAISHHVALGKEYTKPKKTKTHRHSKIRLVISFIFKYRPQDFLQAEGIIPPILRPDTRPHKRAAEILELTDSDDDHEEVLKLQKEKLQTRKEELRKEELRVHNREPELQARLDRVQGKRKKIKLEPQPPMNMPLKTEIIDLT